MDSHSNVLNVRPRLSDDPPLPQYIEVVDHPSHYLGDEPYEVIKVLEAWYDYDIPFNEGNAIKYIARAKRKGNELQDLKKARWYLDRKIEILESR